MRVRLNLSALVAVCMLFSVSVVAGEEQVHTPIGNNTGLVCLGIADFGNLLLINNGTALGDLGVQIGSSQSQIRRIRRKIRASIARGRSSRARRLRSRYRILRGTLRDLKRCRDGTGDYLIPEGGGGTLPVGQTACSIVEGTHLNSLAVSPRIINGAACSNTNSPVVMLMIYDTGSTSASLCTGTVVAADVVITAGHCLDSSNLGSVDIVTGAGTIVATGFAVHQSYLDADGDVDDGANDVGVLQAGSNLGMPIADVLSTNDLTVGETVVIAGYGRDNNDDTGNLRAGTTTISDFSAQSIIAYFGTSPAEANTCNGDSGGPLFVRRGSKWILGGTTSGGNQPNCVPIDRSFYANISDPSNISFVNGIFPGLID